MGRGPRRPPPSLASCTDDDGQADPDDTTTSTTTVPLYESTFETGDCPVEVDAPERVTCGTVTVPERHAEPDGPTIEVAIALIEPETADPAAHPLLLLQGGPGSGFVAALPSLVENPIVEDRTMVLMDPRGTGFSEPFLGCSELDDIAVPLLALDPDDPEARQLRHDAVVACHERLTGEGIDLAAYNYTEISADVAVIRHALGYAEWDLYGISNGGRMALEVLRRRPEGVRSAVLDAALPPQGSLLGELWPHAQRAFDVRFDEEVGLEGLRSGLYDTGLIPLLPRYIGLLTEGEGFAEVAGLIAGGRGEPGTFSHGMSMSVLCQEEIAFLDADFFEQQAAELPALASVIENPTDLDDCAVWDVGKADPSIHEPVTSDVPALVLVGEYDPVHPRSSSETIVATFSNAQLFEFPGLGHGTVRVHECPRSMTRAFLGDPSAPVDDSCIAEMPPPAWL